MIQSTLKDFICTMHKKKIISICLNQNCKQNRLVCFECLKQNEHISHQNDLQEFENFEIKLVETKSKYNNLLTQLTKMMDDVQNLYNKIKKGIDDKYNLPIQRINALNNEELTQYIDNMISFEQYKDSIRNQIEQNCQEFEQELENCLIELQLDILTYNEINNENKDMAEKLYKQGYALYWEKDDYDGAIKLFDQALSYDRNHKNSLWLKGKCLSLMGKRQDAILQYDKVLSIDPRHVSSLNDKGAALRQMDQHQEALECQKKGYAINPNHKLTLFEYGTTLRQLNQFSEALTFLDKALSIDQNHFLSLQSKGICLIQLQKYNEALDCFNKAIQINSKNTFCQNQLKICQEKLNQSSQ